MIVYVDSSVLMRMVLQAPGSLREWTRIEHFVSSALLGVECARTIHRLRALEPLTDEEFARRWEALQHALAEFELVGIDPIILDRASGALAFPLKTLDAIHLATAILWRERAQPSLQFATHNKQLGLAARTSGFEVLGL